MEHWYGLPEALFTDRTVQDYPGRLQLQRRVAPLRPGRPPVEAGGAAGQPDAGTRCCDELRRARLHPRSHLQHLRGQPRPDARPPRRLARRATPCPRCGISSSPTATPTAPTGSTGPPRTRSPGATTTGSGCSSSTTTRTAAAG